MIDTAPGTDRALIERFLEMMAAEAGAAKNTIAAYRSDLSLASDFLGHGLASASADDLARLGAHWLEIYRRDGDDPANAQLLRDTAAQLPGAKVKEETR